LPRTITSTQTTNKIENKRFNEVREIAYVLGAEGREILMIKSPIHVTNKGTTPLFSIDLNVGKLTKFRREITCKKKITRTFF